MWYCDIVIFWQKNYDPISQYHTECDIVIFYQNGSSRMSQYHNIMWMWYCDIRLKLLEQKGNILGKVLYFYVILWYCDILTKELWPNITISHGMWYCDIQLKLLEQ